MEGKNSLKRGKDFLKKAIIFPAIFLSGFFVFSNCAQAYSDFVSQTSGSNCDINYSRSGERIFGQSLVSTSTNLTAVGFKVSTPAGILEIKICEGDFSTPNTYSNAAIDWNCDHANQKPLLLFSPDVSLISTDNNGNFTKFSFPFPIATEINKKYFILLKVSGTNICYRKYSDSYSNGAGRIDGANIIDFSFNTYSTNDSIDWTSAIPDKIKNVYQDEYYSSGSSLKINWAVPNLYTPSFGGDSIYEIEYWKKVFDCGEEYNQLIAKKQEGGYIAYPSQKQEAIIKNLEKDSNYCSRIISDNGYQKSLESDIFQFSTQDIDYTEEIDQKNDYCEGKPNMNSTMHYGQSFVTDKNNVSSVSIPLYAIGSDPNPSVELRLCRGIMTTPEWNDPNQDWNCDQAGQKLLASVSALTQNGWTNFHFPEPVTVDPNEPLFFIIKSNKISACGQGSDYYPDGYARAPYMTLDFSFRTFYDPDFQEVKRNPVIIVPGIMGSYLKESSSGDEVWLSLLEYAFPGGDNGLRRLVMDNEGRSIKELYADKTIDNVLLANFYKGLIEELEKNGYEKNKSLFVFPYDWRYDLDCLSGASECLDEGVDNLKEEIDWVKNETDLDKVDIVAHSMGGLISKSYIEHFGQDNINKLITIATPNFGSPKSAKILMYGDTLDICLFGECFLNESTVKEISQNIPSIYQLLPSQKYFDYYRSYLADVDDVDKNGIKGNLNYNDSVNFLFNSGRNPYLLNQATYFHDRIDDLEIDNSYSISGCGLSTIEKIYVLNKEKNGKYEYGLSFVSGDGTVPLESSKNFGQEKYFVQNSKHGTISSSNGVKQLVSAILGNEQQNFDFSKYENIIPVASDCTFDAVQIDYHSPITMEIYDEDGNFVGRNENGDIEIGIPGAQYEEIEDNKFVVLPEGGNYTIKGAATADGSFNARIQKIQNGEYVKESYFNEVPLASQTTNTEVIINSGQEEYEIKIDNDNDGIFEEKRLPDAVLMGEEISDLTKPETSINLTGQVGNNDFFVSDVAVELSAQDDNSGLLKTEYSLDDGLTWINYDNKFLISNNGTTTILYSSTDRAGNRGENKETVIKIDKEVPEINAIIPQDNQEISRNEILNIKYLAEDEFSGITTATEEIYFDGQKINSKELNLSNYSSGEHSVKIKISDLAGNYSEKEIPFYIISDIDSVIEDINILYERGDIKKSSVKNDLIRDLNWIQSYINKNAKKETRRGKVEDKIMEKCVAKKGQAWCDKKLGKIFDKIDYRLSVIQQKIIKVKYNLILSKLDLYKKLKQITDAGYGIIKEDIKYLISKL